MPELRPVNLADKLSTFSDYYQPRTVGQFNGHDLISSRLALRTPVMAVQQRRAGSSSFTAARSTTLLVPCPVSGATSNS
jgi:hypothetical protein